MRLCGPSLGVLKYVRSVSVRPLTEVPPPLTKVPLFGKRRRTNRKKIESDELWKLTASVSEEEAKVFCQESCGFIAKPAYMQDWRSFYSELKKVELCWSLIPACNGEIHLEVFDRSEEPNLLHSFRGKNPNKSSSIADLFEAFGSIVNGSLQEENVFFTKGGVSEALRIQPEKREMLFPPDSKHLGGGIPPQSLSISVALDIKHVNMSNCVVTPLFTGLSFQAFCFAFLNSIPAFLKRNDIGIKNIDFVSRDQMNHFRYGWTYLRREAWLSPLELGEFDLLLPLK